MHEVYENLTTVQVKEIEDAMREKQKRYPDEGTYEELMEILHDLNDLEGMAGRISEITEKYKNILSVRRKGSELRVCNRAFISAIKEAIKST